FSAVYGLQGLSCALGWGNTPVVLAWAVAIAVQASVLAALHATRLRIRHGVARWAGLALGAIGLIAVIWTLFPVVLLRACV
ncbi:MAG: hypothetical protein ACK4RZ_18265, partial [Paracoccaceae bacterium]